MWTAQLHSYPGHSSSIERRPLMADILQQILATKRAEIAAASAEVSLAAVKKRAAAAGAPRARHSRTANP